MGPQAPVHQAGGKAAFGDFIQPLLVVSGPLRLEFGAAGGQAVLDQKVVFLVVVQDEDAFNGCSWHLAAPKVRTRSAPAPSSWRQCRQTKPAWRLTNCSPGGRKFSR